MSKFEIAIIKPNNYIITDIIPKNLELDKIEENIEDFIDIVSVENTNEMMEIVVDKIQLTSDIMGYTTKCCENENYVYQICHTVPEKSQEATAIINGIASHLGEGQLKIYGTCVLIKTKILSNNTCESTSVNINDIAYVLQRKFLHTGVIVRTDESVDEFTFSKDPIEQFTSEMSNYRYLEMEYLNMIFMIFIELVPKHNTINKKTSILSYSHKIHGDTLIVLKTTENEYVDLDKQLFNKVMTCISDLSIPRTLIETEDLNGTVKNGKQLVMNFYTTIANRYLNYCKKYTNDEYQNEIRQEILNRPPLNIVLVKKEQKIKL
ncbi:MAG: hypothetical protein Edafosvirus30_6 [Edafosvirus sp.]|uniref:Uncharacterized protein n=1 Tax=Edafosvirus sp. TaxID=2487765 RepID=A0A3G4ZV31_9VIRU|nr:MAG: hypothetical protein Edafosvirus30_6 [Edafosvirus sp.]